MTRKRAHGRTAARRRSLVAALENPACYDAPRRRVRARRGDAHLVGVPDGRVTRTRSRSRSSFRSSTSARSSAAPHFCREELRLNRRLAPSSTLRSCRSAAIAERAARRRRARDRVRGEDAAIPRRRAARPASRGAARSRASRSRAFGDAARALSRRAAAARAPPGRGERARGRRSRERRRAPGEPPRRASCASSTRCATGPSERAASIAPAIEQPRRARPLPRVPRRSASRESARARRRDRRVRRARVRRARCAKSTS